jgi:ubiquinone/menaquinone biosynthesis C-methylase UbiE
VSRDGEAESLQWYTAYRNRQLMRRRTSAHARKLRRLGAMDLARDARILDIACGTGEALRILHAAGFTDLTGSDIMLDPDLRNEPWAELVETDACEQPFADRSFDAVLCMHSLHHLGGHVRVVRALDDAVRVLKPGGRLMLVDHYDSVQLRAAFWALHKKWLTWPTAGLRSFAKQCEEEWPYLYDYLDASLALRSALDALDLDVEVEERGLFFFYWTGRKRP